MNYWNKIYDEILGYYFWEPQHLGRQKGDKNIFKITDYKKLIEHSKKLEVSLNHQLSLFFSLAPNDFVLKFFNQSFSTQFRENFVFDIAEINEFVVSINDFSQQDLWFVGEKSIVEVEMKLGAKTTIEQLIKYVLLNLLYQEKHGTHKDFYLLYLARDGIELLWNDKNINFANLREKIEELDFHKIKTKGNVCIQDYKERVLELFDLTSPIVSYTGYIELGTLLNSELKDSSNEVYTKLLLGVIRELEERELLT